MRSRDEISELIESYIIENGLTPGDKLPSERDMCELWDLNRMTLRNALSRLAHFGVVVSKVGLGTFVAQPRMVRNLQDTIGFSQAVSESGYTPSHLVIGSQIIEANKYAVRHLHVMLASPVLVLRRVNLIDECPVSIETTWVNARDCQGIEKYDFAKDSLYRVLKEVYGIVPKTGSEKISITKVDEEESEILNVPLGTSAFFQTGLIQDEKNNPVEFFKNIVLPQHIIFGTELRRTDTYGSEE